MGERFGIDITDEDSTSSGLFHPASEDDSKHRAPSGNEDAMSKE